MEIGQKQMETTIGGPAAVLMEAMESTIAARKAEGKKAYWGTSFPIPVLQGNPSGRILGYHPAKEREEFERLLAAINPASVKVIDKALTLADESVLQVELTEDSKLLGLAGCVSLRALVAKYGDKAARRVRLHLTSKRDVKLQSDTLPPQYTRFVTFHMVEGKLTRFYAGEYFLQQYPCENMLDMYVQLHGEMQSAKKQ